MSTDAGLELAARRIVEFKTVKTKLTDAANEVQNDEDVCTTDYQTMYTGTRRIKTLLNQTEWSCYQYASLLHMLGEMIDRTHEEFGTRLQNHSELRYELPKLIGLRHTIHHNGLIGFNITEVQADAYVVVPTVSVKRHGNWDDSDVPDFETFFHSAGDLIFLSTLIVNSRQLFESIISDAIKRIEEQFDQEEIRRRASNIEIYSTQS